MSELAMSWGRMAWWDSGGAGLPLVLLHGTGCDSEDWDPMLAHLPASVRVVRLDFRGHGASDAGDAAFTLDDLAADTLAVTEHLGLRRMVLAGHSLGGIVAMVVAARSPAVAGLVLLEGWTNRRAMGAFREPRLFGGLDAAAIARIEAKSRAVVGRFRPDVWAGFCRSVQGHDSFPFLARTTVPTVEVYGDAGSTPDTERALQIPKNPHIRTVWIAGAGHYLPHEKPAEIARICREASGR
jgi:3-oxoadipate enol-lactonase